MKLILYQATFAITEIDFVPGPFRCQIVQQHLDFAPEVVQPRVQKSISSWKIHILLIVLLIVQVLEPNLKT